jgi:hypothetical protein
MQIAKLLLPVIVTMSGINNYLLTNIFRISFLYKKDQVYEKVLIEKTNCKANRTSSHTKSFFVTCICTYMY